MNLRLLTPLLLFVIPTLVIGFGFVIPGSCIEGINELTIGFLGSVGGAVGTYLTGVQLALRQRQEATACDVRS